MSSYEYTQPDDRLDDADARYARDVEAEHVEHRDRQRADRLAEHVTPDPRPAKRIKRKDVPRPDETWRESVFERDGFTCPVHGDPKDCEWPPAAHHVVLAQQLRRDGHVNAVYARAAGMTLCSKAHRQHHNRTRPVLLEEIPAECLTFARELGYGEWLQRHYPSREAVAA